jgi:hypothetical protein
VLMFDFDHNKDRPDLERFDRRRQQSISNHDEDDPISEEGDLSWHTARQGYEDGRGFTTALNEFGKAAFENSANNQPSYCSMHYSSTR